LARAFGRSEEVKGRRTRMRGKLRNHINGLRKCVDIGGGKSACRKKDLRRKKKFRGEKKEGV